MKKKLIALAIISLMLTACGNTDSSMDTDEVGATTTSTTTTTTTVASEPVDDTEPTDTESATTPTTTTVTTTEPTDTESATDDTTTTTTEPTDTSTTTTSPTTTTAKKPTTTTKATSIKVTSASGTMYTNCVANMRSGNSTSYPVVIQLAKNTKVEITGKCDNGWYKVKANDKSGYMSSSVLSKEKVTTTTTVTTKKPTTTTTKKPSTDNGQYAITGILKDYEAVMLEQATEQQKQNVIDDMCNYLVNNFEGVTGEVIIHSDYVDKWCFEYRDVMGWRDWDTEGFNTLTIPKPITTIVNSSMTFELNARNNLCVDTQFEGSFYNDKSAEEKYKTTLCFQSACHSLAEKGFGFESNTGLLDGSFEFYFCIEADFDTSWGIWFLSW